MVGPIVFFTILVDSRTILEKNKKLMDAFSFSIAGKRVARTQPCVILQSGQYINRFLTCLSAVDQ